MSVLSVILILLHTHICLLSNIWLVRKCRSAKSNRFQHVMLGSIAIVNVYRATVENGVKLIISQGWSTIEFNVNCTLVQFFATFFGLLNSSFYILLIKELIIKSKTKTNYLYKSYIIPIATWFYAMVWSILPLFGWGQLDEIAIFTPYCKVSRLTSYGLSLFVVTCSIFLTSVIILRVKSKRYSSNAMNYSDNTKMWDIEKKKQRKLNLMSTTILVVYAISWIPFLIYIIVNHRTKKVPSSLKTLTEVSAQIGILQNPLVYFFWNQKDSEFSSYFRRKKKRSGSSHDFGTLGFLEVQNTLEIS